MSDLLQRLKSLGYDFAPVFDGKIHRFKRGGSNDSGWFIGLELSTHLGVVQEAWFGDWATGEKHQWNPVEALELTKEELAQLTAEREKLSKKAREERESIHASSALRAKEIYRSAQPLKVHPYLTRKKISPGILEKIHGDSILVPIYGPKQELFSLQFINKEKIDGRDKTFLPGGRIDRGFSWYTTEESPAPKVLHVAEGYATAATVSQITGLPTLIALNTSNLVKLAGALEESLGYRPERVVIAADNDGKTEGNPGIRAAKQAKALLAKAGIPAEIRFPEAPEGISLDWNDASVARGFEPTKREFLKIPKNGLMFQGLGDLFAKPPENIRWLLDGVLKAGGTSCLAAKPKVGKSTLARHLAFCVARGLPFLGRATLKGPAMLILVEENEGEIIAQMRLLGASPKDPLFFHFSNVGETVLEELEAEASKVKPALIVIDTLFRTLRVEDSNSYSEVSRALDPLQGLALRTGAHIMTIHHAGKTERPGADGMIGSTAIQGAFDSNLMMDRKESGERTLMSIQRYGQPFEKTLLEIDPDSKLYVARGSVKEVQNDDRNDRVMECLSDAPELLSGSDISDRTGISKRDIYAVLGSLVKRGLVLKSPPEGRFGPRYSINPNAPEEAF